MPTIGEIANMQVGIWDYRAGTSGTVDLAALAVTLGEEIRCLSITAFAGTSESASVKVDDRPTASIPVKLALNLEPKGTIVNPVIVFTNTASYVVEFVTHNFHGYTEGNIN